MISISEDRAIDIGWRIHQAVVDEGRREGVFAYLYHSPDGRAWFEKYDRKSKTVSRRFSRELAAEIKSHAAELKVYARWTAQTIGARASPRVGSVTPPRPLLHASGNDKSRLTNENRKEKLT